MKRVGRSEPCQYLGHFRAPQVIEREVDAHLEPVAFGNPIRRAYQSLAAVSHQVALIRFRPDSLKVEDIAVVRECEPFVQLLFEE